MKKSVLLLAMFLFVNIGFTKTPEIINPPRPHAKFKWLLVVRHTAYPEHTHYIYTNGYYALEESDHWVWIAPKGYYETFFTFSNNGIPESENISEEIVIPAENIIPILLKYPNLPFVFLKSKAPESHTNKNKPSVLEKKNSPYSPYSRGTKILWDKTTKEAKLKPKRS